MVFQGIQCFPYLFLQFCIDFRIFSAWNDSGISTKVRANIFLNHAVHKWCAGSRITEEMEEYDASTAMAREHRTSKRTSIDFDGGEWMI
jgi:hypothetical protein